MKYVTSLLRRFYGKLIVPVISSYYRKTTEYTNTGKIALCCIAKLENEYIRFFVEYYKNLNFDKIIIYDNNEPDGELFEDVIDDYIKSGFAEIINFRGKKSAIKDAYQDCYDRYNKEYDWIAFFDCDEFLTFADNTKDIHSFLSQEIYSPYQIIQINWMVYGDNEMLDTDGKNVIERFKNPIKPYDFKTIYQKFPENGHIKSILRGGLHHIVWNSPHYPTNRYYRCCNPRGKTVTISHKQEIDYSKAYLRHYSTKTIGEWVKYKIMKGNTVYSIGETSFDAFYRYNKKTEEKERYAKALMSKFGIIN